jgi:outer membrane protein OmpA-like peptidoglycan-associated protein
MNMKFQYIVFFLMILAACGTSSKLKYAEKLYADKSYAEAAKVCESIKGEDPLKYKILALSQFEMLHMDKAVEAFAKVPDENMAPDDKMKYAEALKQMGNLAESTRIANTISNSEAGPEVLLYRNPLLQEPETKIKVYAEEFNTLDDEMTPFFYQGKMYYLSNHQTMYSPRQNFQWNDKPYLQIADTSGSYDNAFKKINSGLHDGPVSIAEDIDGILFNRNVQPRGKNVPARVTIHQKKISTLKNSKSEEIEFFASEFSYVHPFLNSNGSKLFYASDSPEGKGGMDLYIIVRNEDGSCQEPKSIGDNVNTAADELYPTLLTDSILVFSSNRASGFGGLDIYSSTMDRDGIWSKPRLLDLPINSTRDDFYMIESPDVKGQYYFTTNRDGNDNIYSAFIPNTLFGGWEVTLVNSETNEVLRGDTIKTQYEVSSIPSEVVITDDSGSIQANAKGGTLNIVANGYKQSQASYPAPKHAYFKTVQQKIALTPVTTLDVNGIVKDEKTGMSIDGVLIRFIGLNGMDSLVTLENGTFSQGIDLKKFDKSSYVDVQLERAGYMPKTISHVKLESGSTQLDLNSIADLSMKKINIGDDLGAILAIQPIYFETGKWDITPQGSIELDKIADILLDNPQFTIECGSHTDCRSSRKSNQDLSSKRANATVQYLVNKGVGVIQLKYKGYGEDLPVNDCRCEGTIKTTCTEDELALNRRTEFKVISSNEEILNANLNNNIIKNSNVNSTSINGVTTNLEINNSNGNSNSTNSNSAVVTIDSTATRQIESSNQASILPALVEDIFVIDTKKKYTEFTSFENMNAMPAGAVYMVQVGAFLEDVDTDIFTGLEPIHVEKTNAGFTRYCVGMFTSYGKAEAAMQMLQKRGFTDAFIVGYYNGVRVPVQELHNKQ